jgi:E3 ubiquitin-protein ligase UHRF1
MEDGSTLFDYNVNINDTILITIRPEVSFGDQRSSILEETKVCKEASCSVSHQEEESPKQEATSSKAVKQEKAADVSDDDDRDDDLHGVYKVGTLVDVRDLGTGAWFEGIVERVSKQTSDVTDCDETKSEEKSSCDNIIYHVTYERWVVSFTSRLGECPHLTTLYCCMGKSYFS